MPQQQRLSFGASDMALAASVISKKKRIFSHVSVVSVAAVNAARCESLLAFLGTSVPLCRPEHLARKPCGGMMRWWFSSLVAED